MGAKKHLLCDTLQIRIRTLKNELSFIPIHWENLTYTVVANEIAENHSEATYRMSSTDLWTTAFL